MAETFDKSGSDAVRRLRIEKLRKGLPFMINSNDLPQHHCYLEYPDGRIMLVFLPEGAINFSVVKELSIKESSQLRDKFHLESFNVDLFI